MTGYTVHTGSNEKFSKGWDNIFQGGKQEAKAAKSKTGDAKGSKKSGGKGKKKHKS